MEGILKILQDYSRKSILLLTHHNADPDAICSATALALGLEQMGAKTRIGAAVSVSALSKKVIGKFGMDVEIDPKMDTDLIILLDTSTPGQLSGLCSAFEESKAKKVVIDHHTAQEFSLKADLSYVDESATSASEICYNLLQKLGVEITRDMAFMLIIGMLTDTAHFKYATPPALRTIADILESQSLTLAEIMDFLSTPQDISERIACLKAVQRAKLNKVGNYLVVVSNIGSFEASAARALMRTGADVAAVAAKRGDELRISLRAKSSFVSETGIDLGKDLVPEVAKVIDGSGSGHPTAAGANGKATGKMDEALNFIVDYIQKRVNKGG